jgi:hypothetical protein
MKRLIFILAALFATAQSQTIQTIGAPTTTVVSRGNFRTDSIFYLPKRTKLPTDSGAVRYQISDSSVYYWSGFQWLKLGVNIDTASMLNPYVRGSGTANYLPKFNASRSIVDSKVYESATNLMFNTTTPYFTTSGIGSFDINGSTASVLVLRKADTARGYWSHNGSTMDINNLSAGDIRFYTNAQLRGRFQTDGTFRLNSLTGTGTRSVVADANGVLSASSTPTDLIDTTYISTRAWRQKGDDSLGAIIATKGSGTVTSVATGYGLSGGTITTTGTISADTALLASRLRVGKVVDSLALVKQNVLTNPVTGTGTTNYVPKFTGTSTIGNSAIFETGNNVVMGSATAQTGYERSLQLHSSNTSADVRLIFSDATTGQTGPAGFHILKGAGQDAFIYNYSNTAIIFGTNGTARGRFTGDGELLLNTTTDVGAYVLQANGAIYNTGGAVFAASSGNVGVGTTTISDKLHVSSTSTRIRIESTNNSSNTGLVLIAKNSSGTSQSGGVYIQSGPSESYVSLSGDNSSYHLNVTSGGNVGIGTTSPNQKLTIQSGVGEVAGITMRANGVTSSDEVFVGQGSAGSLFVANRSTNAITFQIGGFTRMNLTNDAELYLNTTTDAGDYKLQVSGNAYVYNASAGSAVVAMMGGARAGALGLKIFNETIAQSTIIALGEESGTSSTPFFIRRYGSTNANASAVEIVNGQNAAMWLSTNSTERIRLHANGGLKFVGQSAAPTAEAGTVYYDTDDNKLKVYNGTTWVDLH